MKKEDLYQLNREAWLEEAFKDAKESRQAREDPNLYKHRVKQELGEFKRKDYERKQADAQATQEAARAERAELEQRLKEAEEKLKKNA